MQDALVYRRAAAGALRWEPVADVVPVLELKPCGRECEPCLATSARARQREQTALTVEQCRTRNLEVVLAPD
jgi:hypothetical protein